MIGCSLSMLSLWYYGGMLGAAIIVACVVGLLPIERRFAKKV